MWSTNKRSNDCVMGFLEREEKEYTAEKTFEEKNGWKIYCLIKYINLQIKKAKQITKRIISPTKKALAQMDYNQITENKSQRIIYMVMMIWMQKSFHPKPETIRKRQNIFKLRMMMKENNCQLKILHPRKTIFRNKSETKRISKERKLAEFVASRPALKKLLKKFLQTEKIMIPEGNLEHQELKKNKQNVKYLGKYNRRSSYLDFFKIDF